MKFIYRQVNLLFFILILLFLYFQLTNWQNLCAGGILFILYILLVGRYWQGIFKRVFGWKRKLWQNKILAWWAGFILLSFISAICVVYYTLTPVIIWWCLVINSFVSWLLHWQTRHVRCDDYGIKEPAQGGSASGGEKNSGLIVFKRHWYLIVLYFILLILGWYFLISHGRGSAVGNSPWQFINQNYLLVFFGLMILTGIILFAKYKSKTVLWLIILLSILQHFYLPLSHVNPWGGDVWRHLANEKQIQNGELVLPVLIGSEAKWREVVGVDLPEAFLIPQKYNYGQLWGTSILLSEVLRVDLIQINIWLIPIIFSLILPLLLFKIGQLLFGSRRQGLWLAWLSFLFFPLQALGGLTLPVSLGFLVFLFALLFWLQYWQEKGQGQRKIALLFSLLMLFGYSLYFIVLWAMIIMYHVSCIINHQSPIINHQSLIIKRILLILLFVFSIFIFPIIELITKISFLPAKIAWWNNLKQMVGQFSGWYYGSAIRPHDILSGNIIFNHTPDYTFVQNIFNAWRWWLIPAMLLILFLVIYGFYQAVRKKETVWRIMMILSGMIGGGYLIGWFVLEGDRLFTRRLDILLAFVLLVFLAKGVSHITYHISRITCQRTYLYKMIILLFIILFSWFTTFTYASGPDIRVVNKDELDVAKYIGDGLRDVGYVLRDKCVLADTWILLPLEALSNGAVVGGSFPIDYQFSQTARVELFNKFTADPTIDDLAKMKQLTGAEKCWFAQKSELITDVNLDKINKIFNSEPEMVGGMFVWQESASITSTVEPLKKEGV